MVLWSSLIGFCSSERFPKVDKIDVKGHSLLCVSWLRREYELDCPWTDSLRDLGPVLYCRDVSVTSSSFFSFTSMFHLIWNSVISREQSPKGTECQTSQKLIFLCSSYPVTSGFYFYFWEKASAKFEVFCYPEKSFSRLSEQRGYFLTVLKKCCNYVCAIEKKGYTKRTLLEFLPIVIFFSSEVSSYCFFRNPVL